MLQQNKISHLLENIKGISTSAEISVGGLDNHQFQIVIPGTSGQVKIETSANGEFWSQLSGDFEVANSTGSMFVNDALNMVRARNVEVADSGVHVVYFGSN
jgi:hypothetical protein